jgi:hypothetical protein
MSKGKHLVVDGRLRGMDREVHCKVAGLQVSPPGAAVFEMTDISIVDAPQGLPDGIYELVFKDSGERVTKAGETWQLL